MRSAAGGELGRVRGGAEAPRPRVDVGVVTFETASLTAAALRRLLDTDQGCELGLLVQDNASGDGTPEVLAAEVPEAEVVVSERNLGFSRAVNRLLDRSAAPWFLALNSDAWPEAGAIGRLVRTAQAHPRAAAVAPLLLRPDGTVEHSTHPLPSLGVAALDALDGRRWLPTAVLDHLLLEGGWHHDRPRRVGWAVGAALLLRRRAVEELGGFDERFFMYVEDLEWCWRAARAGWEVRFEPAARVRHVGNVSGARRFGDRRAALEAANLRRLLPETMGRRRAAAYRTLQASGCAAKMLAARAAGDPVSGSTWRHRLKAELGVLAPPPTEPPPLAARPPAEGPSAGSRPAVAVVVPTHGRADRLGRLVGALERQSLPAERFEVVLVDDGSPDGTADTLAALAAASPLRLHLLRQPVRRGPAAARNLGWRSTGAPVVAFTDDDCVPDPGWLAAGLAAMGEAPRVVVGRTRPPASQLALAEAPFSRVLQVESCRFFETCNVLYRRVDLEAAGGFDERFRRPSGEDTRLGLAVTALGVTPVFDPEALVEHDVRPGDFRASLRETLRWTDLPLVLQGRADARPGRVHRLVFWKPTHPPALLAATGLVLAPWRRATLLLVLPWVHHRLRRSPEGRRWADRLAALPGALVLDLCEVGVMSVGSARHRTVLL